MMGSLCFGAERGELELELELAGACTNIRRDDGAGGAVGLYQPIQSDLQVINNIYSSHHHKYTGTIELNRI
ncbi:hypothetical protein RB195_020630 [Necator americanus]|uniref:Uncharacterized protein n=1 Tax=Necator americanus TaxID=51031 RepID=A0ABR1CMH5_NECAM